MDFQIYHFYPDLMNLYGSYANVRVLCRLLERLGHRVELRPVLPGDEMISFRAADFLYMGAGTERRQAAAMGDFIRYADTIKALAGSGTTMLFAGTAMELLGGRIDCADGTAYDGIGLAEFTTVQSARRMTGDVYGQTDLYDGPVVGYMNKCAKISGVGKPLLTALNMGFGNEAERGPEGFHRGNVFASELTGPILVKNPRLLETVAGAMINRRGEAPPEEWPVDEWSEKGYAVTAEELRKRWQK